MKDQFFDECRVCKIFRYSGVPILTLNMRFPREGFLGEMSERAYAWAKDTLFASLCREYDESRDPHKRFYFGRCYKFTCNLRLFDGELASYKIETALTSKSGREVFEYNVFGVTVRISDGALLPPDALMDKATRKQYKKKGAESFYLSERGVFAILTDKSEVCLLANGDG